jgi:hypothetical protein
LFQPDNIDEADALAPVGPGYTEPDPEAPAQNVLAHAPTR